MLCTYYIVLSQVDKVKNMVSSIDVKFTCGVKTTIYILKLWFTNVFLINVMKNVVFWVNAFDSIKFKNTYR